MAAEMGKLAKAGRDEALKCAWGCRFYAEHAAIMLADAPVSASTVGRQLRALSAARRDPRDHAVELSVLAGVPRGRSGADGRQRRPAQARVERAAVRAR